MKKIKSTLSALALSMTLCAPVIAQPHTPVISNTLSAHDLEMAFENAGEPMELALLSEQEMRETKGAVLPTWLAVMRGSFWGAWGHAGVYLGIQDHGAYQWSGISGSMLRGALLGAISINPAFGAAAMSLEAFVQSHGGLEGALQHVTGQ